MPHMVAGQRLATVSVLRRYRVGIAEVGVLGPKLGRIGAKDVVGVTR
jgi:hypothetical protein